MKNVAVIGGGASGLAAIKSCKEEGIDVVCFEKSSSIGGLWRYHDEDVEGLASVMNSTVINTSKEMSAFSDFPPPADSPNFMNHAQICNYFSMYAEHFELYNHIRFNQEIISVAKSHDYDGTGQWVVGVKSLLQQTVSYEIFDGVMICVGHHVYPNMPNLRNQNVFEGKILHSHSMKNVDGFKDLRVLVIGIGNSAVDAAVELSNVAKQVYLSTRRGAWISKRYGPYGLPIDALINCRLINYFNNIMGWKASSRAFETLVLNYNFDHEFYGLKPKHHFRSQHPTINDYLQSKILTGRVIIKKNVEMFLNDSVIFEGENVSTVVDAVVFATGYNIKFPFIDESFLKPLNNRIDLYKLTFSPELKHPSFAVIGLIQPAGSIFPIAEAQSRWFALVMNGKVKLPNPEAMKKEIRQRRKYIEKRFVNSRRHTIQVDYISFMDDITSEYGAKPNMLKMAFSDPILYWVCLTSPCFPYQYRLQGPHSWSEARNAILKFPLRITKPLSGGLTDSKYTYFEVLKCFKPLAVFLLLLIFVLKFVLDILFYFIQFL